MSSEFSYKTLREPCTSLFKEKGSKFWGFAYPVESEADIKICIENTKNLHPKATHHCFAWRLGTDKNTYRTFDDGEPSGTAGKPILGQIDTLNITDCLVVSVRYFGGTKLGVSGLISAYKNSAKETLALAEIIEIPICKKYKLQCEYEFLNLAYQWIQSKEATILEQNLKTKCQFIVHVPLKNHPTIEADAEKFYPIKIEEIL